MQTGNIQRGQKVCFHLYGGQHGIVLAVHGEQKPETITTLGGGIMVTGGNAHLDIVFADHYSKMVPESIVRGVQWDVSEEIATEDEIAEAITNADTAIAVTIKATAEKEQRLKEERESLPSKYPFLQTFKDAGNVGGRVLASKNIKRELAHVFPGHKFSVKSRVYSGGNSIDVAWVDGPTVKAVEDVVSKYEEGHFNGMEDIYEYNHSSFPDVFGGSKYVFANRNMSNEKEIEMAKKYGFDVHIDDYRMIDIATEKELVQDDRDRIHRMVCETDYYVRPENTIVEAAITVSGVVVRKNDEKDGIEILFGKKPSDDVLDAVREHGFRFSFQFGKIWWAKFTQEKWTFAQSLIAKG